MTDGATCGARHAGHVKTPQLMPFPLLVWMIVQCPAGAAQTIHTCIDPQGARSVQNIPCGHGSRTVRRREFATPVDSAEATRRRHEVEQWRADQREREARAVRRAYPSYRPRRAPGPSPCEAARAQREATLERVGLRRNFDLLRRLDDMVWKACR